VNHYGSNFFHVIYPSSRKGAGEREIFVSFRSQTSLVLYGICAFESQYPTTSFTTTTPSHTCTAPCPYLVQPSWYIFTPPIYLANISDISISLALFVFITPLFTPPEIRTQQHNPAQDPPESLMITGGGGKDTPTFNHLINHRSIEPDCMFIKQSHVTHLIPVPCPIFGHPLL
jgi:hypothetical protein